MKTIDSMKCSFCDDVAQSHATEPVTNTQAFKKWWRKVKHSKNLITAETSTGAKVQISMDLIWKAIEEADDKFVVPPELLKKPSTNN